jgi:hypothetical protein
MTPGGLFVLLFLVGLAALAVTTLVVAVRGGLGPADPPASHPRIDPGGFPTLSEPRGALPRRLTQPRRGRGPGRPSRWSTARAAAVVHTARESRVARPMSPRTGG